MNRPFREVAVLRSIRSAALGSLVALAACSSSSTAPTTVDIEHTTFASSLGIDLTKFTRNSSGLYWRDLVAGTGTLAADGKRVGVYYVGNLTNGTQFDARTSGTPFSFTIGAGQVVPGFNEGVRGMKVGGRRQIIIPPELGYGSQGSGAIPGNSILVFTIDLISVQ